MIKVGDKVYIAPSDPSTKRENPWFGTVKNVGRKWITVVPERFPDSPGSKFSVEDHVQSEWPYFTLDEDEEEWNAETERRKFAFEVKERFNVAYGGLTMDQLQTIYEMVRKK